MNTLDEMWADAYNKITGLGLDMPSRDGNCREFVAWQGRLMEPLSNLLWNPDRKFSLSYACAEVLWYLSMTTDITMIKAYAPQYERFAEAGHAFGAYGARWKFPGSNQLDEVVKLLRTKPDTRQAIISMWRANDVCWALEGSKKDLPCTLSLQLLVRNGHLHCIATMRSNDVWLGLPYDVFAFTTIQRMLAAELDIPVGNYYHNAGSEHLYSRDAEKMKVCFKDSIETTIADFEPTDCKPLSEIQKTLRKESYLRNGCPPEYIHSDVLHDLVPEGLESIHSDVLHDLVMGAATKWASVEPEWFRSPYMQQFWRSRKCTH